MARAARAVGKIEAYWDEVAAFLTRRLGDSAIAADLTQEAYLRAAALPAKIEIINARAWLFATARNLLVDHCRRTHVRRTSAGTADGIDLLPDDRPGIDSVLLAREELKVLVDAVEALPPRTRAVFQLHKFEGKSYAAIAEELGIAKNTVMVHMVNALRHCREALRRHRDCEDANNGSGHFERLPMA